MRKLMPANIYRNATEIAAQRHFHIITLRYIRERRVFSQMRWYKCSLRHGLRKASVQMISGLTAFTKIYHVTTEITAISVKLHRVAPSAKQLQSGVLVERPFRGLSPTLAILHWATSVNFISRGDYADASSLHLAQPLDERVTSLNLFGGERGSSSSAESLNDFQRKQDLILLAFAPGEQVTKECGNLPAAVQSPTVNPGALVIHSDLPFADKGLYPIQRRTVFLCHFDADTKKVTRLAFNHDRSCDATNASFTIKEPTKPGPISLRRHFNLHLLSTSYWCISNIRNELAMVKVTGRNRTADRAKQMRRLLQAMQAVISLRRCVRLQCAPLDAAQMDLWLRLVGARIVEVMRRVEGL